MNSSPRTRVVAILQARMGSTRLPGKVLADIAGRSMLARVVERIQRMQRVDAFVVATSSLAGDDAIADACATERWPCFRGPERDVLERYLRAAQSSGATDVVRVTADCPLVSWEEADRLIAQHLESGADYTHNLTCWGSGLPVGTGVEAITIGALGTAWIEGLLPHHREHVTEFVYENPRRFQIGRVRAPSALDRATYRLTVDTAADLALIRTIHARLAPDGTMVSLERAIELLDDDPVLAASNLAVGRLAG